MLRNRDDVLATADRFSAAGVRRILALRRGPTLRVTAAKPFHRHGRADPCLVDRLGNIRTSAYPDIHKRPDADSDFEAARKVTGASEAVTQFFFDADNFRLRDRLDDMVWPTS